jgi:hypothetical protein
MSPWLVPVLVVAWGLCVLAGYVLGKRKGRPVTGLLLTAILSVAGLAILACSPRAARLAEPPVTEPAMADGLLPGDWEPSQAHTDSWIWR